MPTTQTIQIQAAVQPFRDYIFDRFSRSNSAVTLDTLDSGQSWAVEAGTWGVSEQLAYAVSGASASNGAVVETNVATAVLIEVRVTVTAGHDAGLIFRSDGVATSNKWLATLTITTGGQLTLKKIVGGSTTTVATITGLSIIEGQTVKLGAHLFDSTIKIFIDDVLIREVSDAANQARTKHGIIITANGSKNLDNFFVKLVGGNPTVQILANLLNTTARTLDVKAAVKKTIAQTITSLAALTTQTLQRFSAKAKIQTKANIVETAGDNLTGARPTRVTHEDVGDQNSTRTVANGQDVYIWTLDTQFLSSRFANLTARANIRNTTPRTIQAKGKLTNQQIQMVSVRANILPRFSRTIFIRGKIVGPTTRTFTARANLLARTVRTLDVKARISRIQFPIDVLASIVNTVTRTLEVKAAITPQTLQRIDIKAAIQQVIQKTFTAKARILPDTHLNVRTHILGYVTGSVEVDFNVAQRVTAQVVVSFNAGNLTKTSRVIEMKAKILSPRTASVEVEFNVNNPMPSELTTRPTERVKVP